MKQYRKMSENIKLKKETINYKRKTSVESTKSPKPIIEKKDEINNIINSMKNILTIGIKNPISFINNDNIDEVKIINKDIFHLNKIKHIENISTEIDKIKIKAKKLRLEDIKSKSLSHEYIKICKKNFDEIFNICFSNIDDSIYDQDMEESPEKAKIFIPDSSVKNMNLSEKNVKSRLSRKPTVIKLNHDISRNAEFNFKYALSEREDNLYNCQSNLSESNEDEYMSS
jgi:hypothetical protein